jgi:hypothetical protein
MGKFCAGVAGKLVIGAIALLLIAFGVTQCQNAQNSGREARVRPKPDPTARPTRSAL